MATKTVKKTTTTKTQTNPKEVSKPNKTKPVQTNKDNNNPFKVRHSRVKKWDKALLKKRIDEWEKHIEVNGMIPTLQSFFMFIPKRTVNNWKNNVDQEELYNMYMDRVYLIVENYMTQRLLNSNANNVASSIFYMKSVFKYTDKPEQTGDQYQIAINLDNNGANQLKENKKKGSNHD